MTGARAALPPWTDIMMGYTRGRPTEEFPVPAGTSSRTVCAESGMLATEACPNVTTELFAEGSEPTELCSTHAGRPVPQPQPPAADTSATRPAAAPAVEAKPAPQTVAPAGAAKKR
jgi:membrane carboxypeptidase/penicillin-binding protein